MTTTTNTASQGVSWTVFGAECLGAVLAAVFIALLHAVKG